MMVGTKCVTENILLPHNRFYHVKANRCDLIKAHKCCLANLSCVMINTQSFILHIKKHCVNGTRNSYNGEDGP